MFQKTKTKQIKKKDRGLRTSFAKKAGKNEVLNIAKRKK